MPADDLAEPRQVLLPGRRNLLVRLNVKDGLRPALLELLNTYTDGLSEEPGTEMFIVHVDPEDENVVWLYEVFRDAAAQDSHRAAEGFARLMTEIPDLLAAPPGVLRLDPLRMSMQEGVLAEDLTL